MSPCVTVGVVVVFAVVAWRLELTEDYSKILYLKCIISLPAARKLSSSRKRTVSSNSFFLYDFSFEQHSTKLQRKLSPCRTFHSFANVWNPIYQNTDKCNWNSNMKIVWFYTFYVNEWIQETLCVPIFVFLLSNSVRIILGIIVILPLPIQANLHSRII